MKVYAKPDDRNRVIAIKSEHFIPDLAGWVLVDEGVGIKYDLAEGNYLPGPATTDEGVPRYKLVDGGIVERTLEEITVDLAVMQPPPISETNLLRAQVQALITRGEFLEDVIAELAMMVL